MRAEQEAAAAAAAGQGSGRVVRQEKPLLESLAELMGVPTHQAAQQLLTMTPAQRQQLRADFAAQDGAAADGRPHTPADSGTTAPMSD